MPKEIMRTFELDMSNNAKRVTVTRRYDTTLGKASWHIVTQSLNDDAIVYVEGLTDDNMRDLAVAINIGLR